MMVMMVVNLPHHHHQWQHLALPPRACPPLEDLPHIHQTLLGQLLVERGQANLHLMKVKGDVQCAHQNMYSTNKTLNRRAITKYKR